LSLYRPGSEISRLNALAAREPVRVTPEVFRLLGHAKQLAQETAGAFDISIAPLVRCWGFMGGSGHYPAPDVLAAARTSVGMHLVELDPGNFTVRFTRPGVMLDLGAIGKGYAIERAAEILRDAGVTSALLHGGTSTVFGLSHPPEGEHWRVSIENPADRPDQPALRSIEIDEDPTAKAPFAVVGLRDDALSVSAIWGKFFQVDGKTLGHIIDPRTGAPAEAAALAAVAAPSATETDALSTALLTLGLEGHERIAGLGRGIRTLVVTGTGRDLVIRSQGIQTTASQ